MSSLESMFGPSERTNGAEAEETATAEQRVQQLLALNRAAIAITSELELDSLLQRIVDVARELVGCKYAALGVLGDDGYIERFPTSGISETEREKIGAPPRGHGLLGVMLRAGRTLRIPDISKDPRRSGFPPNHPPMASLLGVPIFVRGKLMGDLYLTEKIGRSEFDEEDEWLVQLLATHAATALTNAQLHAENVQAFRNLQALLNVTQAINRSVHLDEVLPVILQAPVDLLGASGAAVYLLEAPPIGTGEPPAPVDGAPRILAGGPDEGEQKAPEFIAARYAVGLAGSPYGEVVHLPIDRSVAGRALREGATQVVPDTHEEPETTFPHLADDRPLRSLVVVPLLAGGRTLGVLGIYSDRVRAFDNDAVQLLEAFGAQASTAIHNAGLYAEAQRGREAAEKEQQRLRELEQMKDEFLSMAAHELRTPLTSIRMSAGLALDQMRAQARAGEGKLDPRLIDLMALVEDGSQRMHSLVNDLLDLTRLEQGRAALALEEVDLREVVRDSVEATGQLFESKDQNLDVRLPEARCNVKGDRQRLEQVVINLLSNAHKYSAPGSRVEIRALRSGDECMVAVRDNGPGVPPDERERIFERFYRSSIHRNDRTASTGLGLPIARTVAEMHHGRVWAEPAQGQGSIFTLALPALG
jgi:signal transduction histidine kinase